MIQCGKKKTRRRQQAATGRVPMRISGRAVLRMSPFALWCIGRDRHVFAPLEELFEAADGSEHQVVAIVDKAVAGERTNGNSSPGQGRALDLCCPEPWAEPVDGATLLDELTAAICRY